MEPVGSWDTEIKKQGNWFYKKKILSYVYSYQEYKE